MHGNTFYGCLAAFTARFHESARDTYEHQGGREGVKVWNHFTVEYTTSMESPNRRLAPSGGFNLHRMILRIVSAFAFPSTFLTDGTFATRGRCARVHGVF